MKRVAVIIVNYNTCELLEPCIRNVLDSRVDRQIEIWLVDNGSTDGSADFVAERFPDVHLIRSQVNRGFSGANNLALRQIVQQWQNDGSPEGRTALLLNTDCFVEPDSIEKTASFLDEHADVGIVGPKVLLRDGSLDLACRRRFPSAANSFWKLTGLAKIFPNSPRFAGYNLTYLDPNETTEVDSVMGAYMLVRLEAIRDAGFMDESFFMYGEDLDWAFRIKQFGWRVFYYPEATVLHYKGATSSRQSYRLIIEFYRAMYLFYRKHYAPRTFFVLNWLITAGIIGRGLFALIRNLFRPAKQKRVA